MEGKSDDQAPPTPPSEPGAPHCGGRLPPVQPRRAARTAHLLAHHLDLGSEIRQARSRSSRQTPPGHLRIPSPAGRMCGGAQLHVLRDSPGGRRPAAQNAKDHRRLPRWPWLGPWPPLRRLRNPVLQTTTELLRCRWWSRHTTGPVCWAQTASPHQLMRAGWTALGSHRRAPGTQQHWNGQDHDGSRRRVFGLEGSRRPLARSLRSGRDSHHLEW